MIKKLILWIFLQIIFSSLPLMAQVTVKFKVDITDYLNQGGTINSVVSIAGNFASRGSTTLPDWTPAAGAMTNLGNNVWSLTVSFTGTATDSLNWKYVSGSAWADGDEGNEWTNQIPDCKKPGNNYDRKILLPSSGNWVVSSKWAECAILTSGDLPELSTTAISGITQTTASSGGNITNQGTSAVTARGVCWSTLQDPTVALTTKTVDGTGTGTFTSTIAGLTANTVYYVRAYATNATGTQYGNQVTFTSAPVINTVPVLTTTAASAITTTSASSGGNITSDGGTAVTARGVCWSTTQDPTASLATKSIDGTGTGAFTSSITGLAPATTYYIRAYATNTLGTGYGNPFSITTASLVTDSTVITFKVDLTNFLNSGGIINDTVTIAGNFTDRNGNLPNWSPVDGPMTNLGSNIWAKKVTFKGSSVTTDSLLWKYVQGKAWADGDEGNDWADPTPSCKKPGDGYNRKMLLPSSGHWVVSSNWGECPTVTAVTLPTLTTTVASAITSTTASSGGNVTSDGGEMLTAKGVCWSTASNPTIALPTKSMDGTGVGTFVTSLSSLSPSTTYFVRAYASHGLGTAYGNEISFTTSPEPSADSTVITFAVDINDFLNSGGVINQVVGIAGGFTDRGGNLPNWTPGSGVMANSGNNVWTKTVTFKGPNVTTDSLLWKYIKGADWPDGDEGNGWSNSIPDCKKPLDNNNRKLLLPANGKWVVLSKWAGCPVVTPASVTLIATASISAITQTTATTGGSFINPGSGPITAKGVCWSTTPNPTVSLTTKTDDGSGIAAFTSQITGLATSTMYYVRAYATSSADTVYGNEFSFTSNAATVVLPTISTTAVTSIAQTTAASGGDITSDGGATVTARGVCWSNSPDPTVALTTKTVDGTTTGTFTSSVTGLSPATVYFLRAYATNSLGTAYGNQVSFTTLAANTDSVVVTFAVDVTDFLNGGGSINQVVSIAGSFADRGGNLTNWSPATGAMTPVGNNIWARTVTFHGAPISTDSLFWKYVQGADWADGDEGNDWSDALPDCKKPGNNNDRKILLPTSGSWIVASKWGKCPTIVNGTQSVVEIDKLDVFPNPAHDFLTIFLANNADQSSFRLISAEGKTVASGQFSLGTDGSKLDVSRLPGGIYQLIYTGKTGVYRQKVSIIK